jgi:hypothetical protein
MFECLKKIKVQNWKKGKDDWEIIKTSKDCLILKWLKLIAKLKLNWWKSKVI